MSPFLEQLLFWLATGFIAILFTIIGYLIVRNLNQSELTRKTEHEGLLTQIQRLQTAQINHDIECRKLPKEVLEQKIDSLAEQQKILHAATMGRMDKIDEEISNQRKDTQNLQKAFSEHLVQAATSSL